jgi:hypothetical protein
MRQAAVTTDPETASLNNLEWYQFFCCRPVFLNNRGRRSAESSNPCVGVTRLSSVELRQILHGLINWIVRCASGRMKQSTVLPERRSVSSFVSQFVLSNFISLTFLNPVLYKNHTQFKCTWIKWMPHIYLRLWEETKLNLKGNPSLCLKHQAMKTYGGVEVRLHVLLISTMYELLDCDAIKCCRCHKPSQW